MAVVSAQFWYPTGSGTAYNLADVMAYNEPSPNPNSVVKVEFAGGAPNLLHIEFDFDDFTTAYQAYLDTL